MKLKTINLEHPDLKRWDVVIFSDEHHWLQLWIIKSNYIDHNTDYSWNYIQTWSEKKWWNNEKGKEVLEDIYTPDILYKLTWVWVDELRKQIDYNLL